MSLSNLTFLLSSTEKILIQQNTNDLIDICYKAPIFWVDSSKELLLSLDSIRMNIGWFNGIIHQALLHELKLPNSINQNIGYQYNRYINEDNPNIEYEKIETIKSWVGNRYKLWSYSVETWMYNDEHGNIILEITPVYPKTFRDPEEDLDINDYENWMKSYAPILIRTIPRNIAENWLKQTEDILEEIKANIKMLQEKKKF